jgi:hypothetical protein
MYQWRRVYFKVLIFMILLKIPQSAAQYVSKGAHIQKDWFAPHASCYGEEDCQSTQPFPAVKEVQLTSRLADYMKCWAEVVAVAVNECY